MIVRSPTDSQSIVYICWRVIRTSFSILIVCNLRRIWTAVLIWFDCQMIVTIITMASLFPCWAILELISLLWSELSIYFQILVIFLLRVWAQQIRSKSWIFLNSLVNWWSVWLVISLSQYLFEVVWTISGRMMLTA